MAIFRAFFFLCLMSFASAQTVSQTDAKIPPPRKCADVPIKTTDGKTVHVSQYHGKVVMVAMFTTFCDHCLETLQSLADFQNQLGPKGLQVLAVAIDDHDTNVRPFADRYRFPFPVGYLSKDPAIELGNLKPGQHPTVPLIIFVDWMGNVRFQYQGNDPIFQHGVKDLRVIANGLLKQAADKTGPVYQTKPAGK